MALEFTGRVMAVRTERVEPKAGQDFTAFDSTAFVCLDVATSRSTDVRMGRDFPIAQLTELREACASGQQPDVRMVVFSSKGGLYAERLLEASVAAPAGK